MVCKANAISVIAAVAVAGILTLSVLAAISSTNQAFAQAKLPERQADPAALARLQQDLTLINILSDAGSKILKER